MTKTISKLKNNIEYIYKKNENTPRIALCLNFSINTPDKRAGIYSLMTRLLLQGTKIYNTEELAIIYDKVKYDKEKTQELVEDFVEKHVKELNELLEKTLQAMAASEDEIQAQVENL